MLRALAKDPHRRYESAGSLGADIARYLTGEPIEAKRDSNLYVLGKVLHKYRVVLGVAMGLMAVILIALGVSLTLWHRASRERDRAQLAEANAQRAQAATEVEAYQALIGRAATKIEQGQILKAQEFLAACAPRLRHWEWGWLQRMCHQDQMTINANSGVLEDIAYSPDGKMIASAASEGRIGVWDAATGETMHQVETSESQCAVAFSPNGRYLATGGRDNKVTVYDVAAWEPIGTIEGLPFEVHAVAFDPKSDLLAIGIGDYADTFDETVRIWDWRQKTELHVLVDQTFVYDLIFTHDGTRLVTCGAKGIVNIYNVRTGERVRQFRGDKDASHFPALSISSDDVYVAAAGSVSKTRMDKTTRVWNMDTVSGAAFFSGLGIGR